MRRRAAVLLVVVLGCAETPPTQVNAPAVAVSSHPRCYRQTLPTPPAHPDPLSVEKRPELTGLTPEQVAAVVRGHLPAIKGCYVAQLKRQPTLAGRVVANWTIKPSGEVSDLWMGEKTLASQPAVDCIGEEICGWRFPEPNQPIDVQFPFVFQAAN